MNDGLDHIVSTHESNHDAISFVAYRLTMMFAIEMDHEDQVASLTPPTRQLLRLPLLAVNGRARHHQSFGLGGTRDESIAGR